MDKLTASSRASSLRQRKGESMSIELWMKQASEVTKQENERESMTAEKVLEKVKDWLQSNLDDNCFNLDIEEDNKALLEAIEEWKAQC